MDVDVLGLLVPLLRGAITTIQVAAGALVVAILIGLSLAVARVLYRSRVLNAAIATYIEIFRNVPSLTHLFIIYFGLASVGVRLSSLTAAILGLGLIGGAILTEIFRAGLEAPHLGQREAALAVGMSPFMMFRHILLPQASRVALPPLGNYAIGLVKDTSLVAAIAAPEIMFNARELVNITFQTTIVYGLAAAIYLCITLSLGHLIRRLERRAAY